MAGDNLALQWSLDFHTRPRCRHPIGTGSKPGVLGVNQEPKIDACHPECRCHLVTRLVLVLLTVCSEHVAERGILQLFQQSVGSNVSLVGCIRLDAKR